jgi:hypothetical protein
LDSQDTAPAHTRRRDGLHAPPEAGARRVYQWVKLLNQINAWDENSGREITITGNWGFASIPADVEHWAIITVVTWLRRDVSVFERTFDLAEDRVERPRELPSAVIQGLGHYRRPPMP